MMVRTGFFHRSSSFAVLGALLLAGCGSLPELPDISLKKEPGFPSVQARIVFTDGYGKLNENYVDPQPIGPLALNGLKALGKVDARMAVEQQGSKLTVSYDGQEVTRYDAPPPEDVRAWARVTVSTMEEGARLSPLIRTADPDALFKTVFSGTVSSLDPFTRYLTPDEARNERTHRQGFGGIGIYLDQADPTLIAGVVPETPAEEAGLVPGDRIVTLDGQDVAGKSQPDLIALLRGKIGSKIDLMVKRSDRTITASLTRRTIYDVTVQVRREENDIAYLRVAGFNAGTTSALRSGWQRLIKDKPVKAVILDLRGNPGGLLDQGWDVADLFMSKGPIMTMRNRRGVVDERDADDRDDIAVGLPMVTLVNGRTASASEVVASALQDSGRSLLVGSASYGKGLVQSILELPNEANLYLTTKRMLAPSGYHFQKLGVFPNLCTARNTTEAEAERLLADLSAGRIDPNRLAEDRRHSDSVDEAARTRLLAACPSVAPPPGQNDLDLMVARRLLTTPSLVAFATSLRKAS